MMESDVATFTQFGNQPFLVFCDHATNAIAPDLNCLGLPDDLLQTHIAWDIGAAAVAKTLARNLQGGFLQCEFSRLVIDPNRVETSPDSIPAASDQIPIPGNQMLDDAARLDRFNRFHRPYHERLNGVLNHMTDNNQNVFVISVHSFTNRLMGAADERPWPLGFLWREDEPSAKAMISHLQAKTGWPIGDNEPYDARQFNYSIDRHVGPRGLSHITLEVRQDMVGDASGVAKIAGLIEEGVRKTAM